MIQDRDRQRGEAGVVYTLQAAGLAGGVVLCVSRCRVYRPGVINGKSAPCDSRAAEAIKPSVLERVGHDKLVAEDGWSYRHVRPEGA